LISSHINAKKRKLMLISLVKKKLFHVF
jgi:hypothetical protein